MFKTLRGCCTVAYRPASKSSVSRGHHSEFLETTGTVINGPTSRELLKPDVVEESNGNLYRR